MSSKSNIIVEHAVITFRNFKGLKKGKYGKEGDRTFCVYLDGYNSKGLEFEDPDKIPQYKYGPDWMTPNELIPALERDNWIISWSRASEDGQYPSRPYLKVNVKFRESDRAKAYNPKIWIARNDGELQPIDEESVGTVDDIWIDDAKVRIRPYNYEEERDGIENGKISAQLKDLCITPVADAEEDEDDFYGSYKRGNTTSEVPF